MTLELNLNAYPMQESLQDNSKSSQGIPRDNTKWCLKITQSIPKTTKLIWKEMWDNTKCHPRRTLSYPQRTNLSSFWDYNLTLELQFHNPIAQSCKTSWGVESQSAMTWNLTLPWCPTMDHGGPIWNSKHAMYVRRLKMRVLVVAQGQIMKDSFGWSTLTWKVPC
jgi:hypothetical protein